MTLTVLVSASQDPDAFSTRWAVLASLVPSVAVEVSSELVEHCDGVASL